MARYKRRGRRYKRSTNTIMMKFQSFMDISTKADEMQIISVNAGGEELLKRLPAQFAAYKYYKIGNIAVKLVPASTLPVDPTGLSIAAGDTTVDPRDQLTPGMMRITNGEDVFEDITNMTPENQHKLYNAMLLDPRWFKWMLQSGVKRHATPRYWQIGQLHQDKWPGSVDNVPVISGAGTDDQAMLGTANMHFVNGAMSSAGGITGARVPGSSPYGLFQTGHRGVLGWLLTDGMQIFPGADPEPLIASPPEIEVMKIILPPAYKTKFYYRMFITETVYFREPIMQAIGVTDYELRPLDIFHYQMPGRVSLPDNQITEGNISDSSTGGNYGDD